MDIGGTRARIYEFLEGSPGNRLEIDLPAIDSSLSLEENGNRRVRAISRLVGYFSSHRGDLRIATACAGRKDPARQEVTLLNFAVPLPNLAQQVWKETGKTIGPLFDDDVAAAWGHFVSQQSPLGSNTLNTILLTSGTGLAEAHWVDGGFVDKATYPRAGEFGLEVKLRADGWRDSGDPTEALVELVEVRRQSYPLDQLVLSGRFVHMNPGCFSQLTDRLRMEVHIVDLPEAPALGAVHMLQASAP